eukprot:328920-Prorocentrum_lima.AAC.1
MPRQGSFGAKRFVANVTEVLSRSGQQLYLGGVGEGRRRGPTPKNAPKGGLQKEQVEAKPIQRERNFNLLTIGLPEVSDVLPDGMMTAGA